MLNITIDIFVCLFGFKAELFYLLGKCLNLSLISLTLLNIPRLFNVVLSGVIQIDFDCKFAILLKCLHFLKLFESTR